LIWAIDLHMYVPTCFSTVDLNVRTDREQLTPLLVAAKYNVKDSIVWMMENSDKIDLRAVDCNERNALHLAVCNLSCEYSIDVSEISLLGKYQ